MDRLELEYCAPNEVEMRWRKLRKDIAEAAYGPDDEVKILSKEKIRFRYERYSHCVFALLNADPDNAGELITFARVMRIIRPPPPLPAHVGGSLGGSLGAVVAYDFQRLPEAVRKAAKPFQLDGIKSGVEFGGKFLLADEMGLGKSLQSLGVVSQFTQSGILICCPGGLVENWYRECRKWLDPSLRIQKIGHDTDPLDPTANIVVVSYSLVGMNGRAMSAKLTLGPSGSPRVWNAMICDESHAFQSPDTQRSQILAPVMRAAKHLVLISGTPQIARPSQLFVQMSALFPLEMDWFAFTKRYCKGGPHPFFKVHGKPVWDASGVSRRFELSCVLETRMVRRFQDDVLADLPPNTRNVVNLTIPTHELAKYKVVSDEREALLEKFKSAVARNDARVADECGTKLKWFKSELHRLTGRVKCSTVCDYLVGALRETPPDEKLIVFVHHEEFRNAIADRLTQEKIKFVSISGSVKTSKRQGIIDRLVSPDTDVRVGILSITACCTGLNITPTVTRVLFAEFWWSPSTHKQAECRVHRLGKERPSRCDYLIAEGTLDDTLMSLNKQKFLINDAVVDGKRRSADFAVHAKYVDKFAGFELEPYGVQIDARYVETLPRAGETIDSFVKRTCIPLKERDGEDFLETRDGRLHFTNSVNNDKKAEYYNLREWGGDELPHFKRDTYHILLGGVSQAEVDEIRALRSSYERAEVAMGARVVAVFVKRSDEAVEHE